MEKTIFGKTKLEVSPITLGTWGIGGAGWDDYPDEVRLDTIKAAVEAGINLIDTAPAYNGGRSEQYIGKALEQIGARKDVYIVTDVNLTKNQVVLSKIAYAPKDVPVLLLTDLEGDDTETTTNAAAFPIEVAEGDEADTSGNILNKVSGAGGLQVTFGKVFMFYLENRGSSGISALQI